MFTVHILLTTVLQHDGWNVLKSVPDIWYFNVQAHAQTTHISQRIAILNVTPRDGKVTLNK